MTEARKKEISRSLVAYFCSDGNIDIWKIFIDIWCIPDRLGELMQATGISREELMEYWWMLPDREPKQIIEYGFTGSRTH